MSTSKQNGNDGSESTAVPLACVVCRERHLKCDGVKPTCSRCVDNKQNCYYVQSRRGHRPVRKRQRSAESNHSSELNEASVSPLGGDDRSFSAFLNPLGARMSYQDHAGEPHLQVLPQSADPAAQNIQLVRKPGTSQLSTNTTSEAELQELYYFFFHDAHPCMLPRDYTARTSAAIVPDSVKAAMNYVGSQYSTSARQNPSHLKRLQDSLFSKDSASDGWTVMALLILGIVQRAQDNNDLAAVTLAHAAAIANDLGMNRSEYASAMGGGCPILEEMWRRVWWELYVNDILLAAMRHDTFSRMYSAEADVGLPWEESQYKACTVSSEPSYLVTLKPLIILMHRSLPPLALSRTLISLASFTTITMASHSPRLHIALQLLV